MRYDAKVCMFMRIPESGVPATASEAGLGAFMVEIEGVPA